MSVIVFVFTGVGFYRASVLLAAGMKWSRMSPDLALIICDYFLGDDAEPEGRFRSFARFADIIILRPYRRRR